MNLQKIRKMRERERERVQEVSRDRLLPSLIAPKSTAKQMLWELLHHEEAELPHPDNFPRVPNLVDVSDIFNFFLLREGEGGVEAPEGGGGIGFLKSPGGGP